MDVNKESTIKTPLLELIKKETYYDFLTKHIREKVSFIFSHPYYYIFSYCNSSIRQYVLAELATLDDKTTN